MTCFVFKKEHVVFGRGRAYSTVACLFVPVVDWQYGYSGELGVRGEKSPHVKHGAQWNVAELGRRIVVANDPVGEHGEGVRLVSKVHAFPLYADTTSPVGMVHENQFSPVGMRLFKGREFSGLRPERFFLGACIGGKYEYDEV